ncbi:MAG TPA: hypothetical protein ENI27_08255 [bacterium]|nr:hypothetical protein [bacterium]
MPKYDAIVAINVSVEARDNKAARRHLEDSLQQTFWHTDLAGFTSDRYRARCTSSKILEMKKVGN